MGKISKDTRQNADSIQRSYQLSSLQAYITLTIKYSLKILKGLKFCFHFDHKEIPAGCSIGPYRNCQQCVSGYNPLVRRSQQEYSRIL